MEDARVAYQLYVGFDIAAETFVAAWLVPGGQPGTPVTGEQTPAGFAALQRRLPGPGGPPGPTPPAAPPGGQGAPAARHAGGARGDRELLGGPGGGPARGGLPGRGGQ